MRTYTEDELYEIASVFYNIETRRTPTIFSGLRPLTGPSFNELPDSAQRATVEGLRQRIERETLPGYLARKRRQVGTDVIKPAEDELRERGLL